MKKLTLALLLTLVLVGSSMNAASAETDSEPDGNRHPYVGLMVAQDADGNPLWRCSGTLISQTVFLTAGHCTQDPAEHVEVWFDSDVESGVPDNGYPYHSSAGGTPFTHPAYDPNAFHLYDLGVVVLDEPIKLEEYAALPELDQLDRLEMQPGDQDVTFTAVGYGAQESFEEAAAWKENNSKVRMLSRPHLIQSTDEPGDDFSILLSNHANTGDACFGDSGGPNFIGDTNVIAGVTSYGMNGNCTGTGGVYRVDRIDDLSWLATFGLAP